MSNTDPLKNWDFIGRSYDILRIDPLNLSTGAKFRMVFDLKATELIADHSGMKPPEVLHIPDSGGSLDTTTQLIFSMYDVQFFWKINLNLNVSDPTGERFAFSLSPTYENMIREISSEEKVLTYTKVIVQNYKLQLDNAKTKNLDEYFRYLVKDLPHSSSLLIKEFGTHYARTVFYGGQAYQKLVFKKEDYNSMVSHSINIKAEAKGSFEIAKVGGSIETAVSLNQEFRHKLENKHEQIIYTGGIPAQEFHRWAESVRNAPSPINLELIPISQLLTPEYFPEDADIANQQMDFQQEIDTYVQTNGRDSNLIFPGR